MAELRIYPDANRLARASAELFVKTASSSVAERGRFSVALSGGSTPRRTYELLSTAGFATAVDWPSVHVFWADERCVTPDDDQSNYGMAYEALLGQVCIPRQNVHRIEGEIDPQEAAHRCEQTLWDFFGHPCGSRRATFDLVLLGLGADGHTASLFPQTPILLESSRWVAAQYVDEARGWRVTMTPPAINSALWVTFLVSGSAKAETLRKLVVDPQEISQLPAQMIRPESGNLLWLVDSAAAARLPR